MSAGDKKMINNCKNVERERYDKRAVAVIDIEEDYIGGSVAVRPNLRRPYQRYETLIAQSVWPGARLLELAAGMGEFTISALKGGALVTTTDISRLSLDVLVKRHLAFNKSLSAQVADIENLPFEDSSFDCVICAGSLSYGDHEVVLGQIFRVLKPGGNFICVDSLHHNPAYIVNRWWNYMRGRRSLRTLARMPTMSLIALYRSRFDQVHVEFHGSLAWLMPALVPFLGYDKSRLFSDWFDRKFSITRSAFKFVMVATKGPMGDLVKASGSL